MEYKNKEIQKCVDTYMKSKNFSAGRQINFDRIEEVDEALSLVKENCGGQFGVRIACAVFKPLQNMAVISVAGKSVCWSGGDWIREVARISDNMEMDPLADGGVEINFGFYGVSEKVMNGGIN